MTFRKKAKKSENKEFHLNDHFLESTQEYTYLGIKFTPSGNYSIAQEQLREKAMHAFYGIRKYVNIKTFLQNRASKLFDTMISPILMYNIEVWGELFAPLSCVNGLRRKH